MPNQMIAFEMALAAQRERMIYVAKNRHFEELAQAGLIDGPVRRATTFLSALVQRMGRPQRRGTAPAVDETWNLDNTDRARLGTQSMSTARF